MKCPYCHFEESKVTDSRPSEGNKIRRRRECLSCGKRFTTYEIVESMPIIVVKRDGSREIFDAAKLMKGILNACAHRQVSMKEIEKITNNIEAELQNSLEKEVNSSLIGEMVMERLKSLDEVAYVRFASVYRQFKDIDSFMTELKKLMKEK